jgi:hypothetical protein
MASPPLIPEGLEVTPKPVEFKPSDPIAPGFVTLRGDYVNDRGQRFTLTAAALVRDADALRRFTEDLRVWFVAVEAGGVADAEDGPATKTRPCPDADRLNLESLVREGERCGDEPVLGVHVAFAGFDIVFGRIDPPIFPTAKHYFEGPDEVEASGHNAKLGGLTDPPGPEVVDLPHGPPAKRDANNYCWVKAKDGGGKYTLDCSWHPYKQS